MLSSLISLNSLHYLYPLLLGIVFNTYGYEGAVFFVWGQSKLGWVSFSIPVVVWENGERRTENGERKSGEGWVSFSIPMVTGETFFLGSGVSFGARYRFRYPWLRGLMGVYGGGLMCGGG